MREVINRAELGIARGYGGIWNDIEYVPEKPSEPVHITWIDVFDYDWEDMVWSSEEMRHVLKPEARQKYCVRNGTLYKRVDIVVN